LGATDAVAPYNELAYHKADVAIQHLIDLLAA
jgi:hypothetical protein